MACQSVAVVMDEQALLGLNPNADARYRQRVRHLPHIATDTPHPHTQNSHKNQAGWVYRCMS